MKRVIALLLSLLMLISFTACSLLLSPQKTAATTKEAPTAEEPSPTTGQATQTGVLYADFNCAGDSVIDERIEEYPFEYSGEKKTAEELAEELSNLTGYDFLISATPADDGIVIDWDASSTLVGGLGDLVANEGFELMDADSLRWFMMDSLWRTLTDNLDVENVYYMMEGSKTLYLEDLSPIDTIPSDSPYMGSVFYAAHAGNGPGEEDALSAYLGTWAMNGGNGYNLLHFDEFGICSYVTPEGAVSEYTVEAFADKVILSGDGITEELSLTDGKLADLAGYSYEKNLEIPGADMRFVGTWALDGGAGFNLLRIYPNNSWNLLAADLSESNGSFTVNGDEIDLGGSAVYTLVNGKLEDAAGFSWAKGADLPY